MVRKVHFALLPMACLVVVCGVLTAQPGKPIIVRVLDAKTGQPVKVSSLLVQIDRQGTQHADWANQNEDLTAELKLPSSAHLLSIHATYDSAMQIYVNCDDGKGTPPSPWYPVAAILAHGIVAPSGCGKRTGAGKLPIALKPGEFVFFVRKLNWREQMQDYKAP
jgi:hypothetical protein